MFGELYAKFMIFLLILSLIVAPFMSIMLLITDFAEGEVLTHIVFHCATLFDIAFIGYKLYKNFPVWLSNDPRLIYKISIAVVIILGIVGAIYGVSINTKNNIQKAIETGIDRAIHSFDLDSISSYPGLDFELLPENATGWYSQDEDRVYITCPLKITSARINEKMSENEVIYYMDNTLNQVSIDPHSFGCFEYTENGMFFEIHYVLPCENQKKNKALTIYSTNNDRYDLTYEYGWLSLYRNNDLLYISQNAPLKENKTFQNTMPFEGMDEKYLYFTKLGEPSEVEDCRDFNRLRYDSRSRTYTWYISGNKDNWKEMVIATVRYDDNGNGKVWSIHRYNR